MSGWPLFFDKRDFAKARDLHGRGDLEKLVCNGPEGYRKHLILQNLSAASHSLLFIFSSSTCRQNYGELCLPLDHDFDLQTRL